MAFVINITRFLSFRCALTEDLFHVSQRKKSTLISLQFVQKLRVSL